MNSSLITRILIYALIAVAVGSIAWSVINSDTSSTAVPISQIAQEIEAGNVQAIQVDASGQNITIDYQNGTRKRSLKSSASSLEEVLATYGVTGQTLNERNVTVTYTRPGFLANLLSSSFLFFLFPVVLMIGLFLFMTRQSQGAGNQAMAFGKSKAKMVTSDTPTVTFDDVAGAQEAKEELQEVVHFLKEPEKYVNFGARIPRGLLMVGPPGTGKTLIAKAVAGEAAVPFFQLSGSEFVEMFVGVGASRVRDLFEQAKRHSPCIIFIDEIDAVGRQRGAGLGGSHDEREQTLNQILVEMDGFDTDETIIMIAATNRPDILDPALLRPGRFDRRVIMDRPDVGGREEIFYVHMRGKPIAKEVDVPVLARATPGFTGADIENVVNEAALLSARRDLNEVSMKELQDAIERVQLGPERRSRIITPEEKELVAYHEAGHALIAWLLPEGPEVRKVTVIPRGMAGGVTWFLADENQLMTTKKFKAQIATALGGRVAEEIIFGDVTTGASGDLQSITQAAKSMVTQYGMSEGLGLRVYGALQEMVFLGREISEQRDYSDAIAEKIDLEVNEIIATEYARVTQLMTDNRDKLELIANTLLEVETLDMKAFADLLEE